MVRRTNEIRSPFSAERGRRPEFWRIRLRDFVANLPLDRDALARAVIGGWCAEGVLVDWPEERTRRLAREKYSHREWNYRS